MPVASNTVYNPLPGFEFGLERAFGGSANGAPSLLALGAAQGNPARSFKWLQGLKDFQGRASRMIQLFVDPERKRPLTQKESERSAKLTVTEPAEFGVRRRAR